MGTEILGLLAFVIMVIPISFVCAKIAKNVIASIVLCVLATNVIAFLMGSIFGDTSIPSLMQFIVISGTAIAVSAPMSWFVFENSD
ncbi:hypothetical protein L5593_007088 [Pseudomonas aeruginosa]|nr:hypothetical protein [Pseudomonas aeruginosa]ELS0939455.1 hypothetical protein [Pseudomonas aeruginosa]